MGETLPIYIFASFLRLSDKYEIETLRTEALKRLLHDYTARFDSSFIGNADRARIIFLALFRIPGLGPLIQPSSRTLTVELPRCIPRGQSACGATIAQ